MIKKPLRTFLFIFCSLAISAVAACSDGVYSERGYIPEKGQNDVVPIGPQTPPWKAPPPEKSVIPDFILRIMNEKYVPAPEQLPAPHPAPAPKKHEVDPLDAS